MTSRAAFPISGSFTVNANGVVVPANGATIEVRKESDGTLAVLTSDRAGVVPLGNPFTADTEGRFVCYAVGLEGGYQLKVTSGASTLTLHNVAVGTAAEFDATTYTGGLLGAADAPAARGTLGLTALMLDLDRIKRRTRHFAALNLV